ncbi:MAG: hypothetical protein AAFR11_06985 [Pseudomonadota bacterium]
MSKPDHTTSELFLRLGATPQRRSTAADKLFRRLRRGEEESVQRALAEPPRRVSVDVEEPSDD